MTANRPQPRPGVLDIAAYVPGKSTAPGVAKVFKLSSNETPLGPSPKAIAAYNAGGAHLEDYPDGAATELREAIGRAFGLDPTRIICGAGSDDLLNLLAHAYLPTATRRSTRRTASWSIRSHARPRRKAGCRAGEELHRRRRRDPGGGDAAHAHRLPRQSEQSDRHLCAVRRGQAPAPRCRRNVLLVLDAAYAEYVRRNDYEAGIELVATSENVVMSRTFSKIYGLAALRLGWMYGPAHVVDALNRIRGPFNVNTPAMTAGIAAIDDTAHVERARAQREMARLAHRGDRQARPQGDAERRQFRADPFPGDEGQDRRRRRRLPDQARPDPAPRRAPTGCRMRCA